MWNYTPKRLKYIDTDLLFKKIDFYELKQMLKFNPDIQCSIFCESSYNALQVHQLLMKEDFYKLITIKIGEVNDDDTVIITLSN